MYVCRCMRALDLGANQVPASLALAAPRRVAAGAETKKSEAGDEGPREDTEEQGALLFAGTAGAVRVWEVESWRDCGVLPHSDAPL